MNELTSGDIRRKKPSETRHVLVDFSNCLDRDDTVNETISSVSVSAAGLSISGEQVTDATRRINGRIVPAGKAIEFTVSGGVVNDFSIIVQVVTSGGQLIDRTLTLEVRDA